MNTKLIGNNAEQRVAIYLEQNGYRILDRNWRTPAAEIDLVGVKNGCVYFIEVKYRRTTSNGDGFEYITTSKLHHMYRAAELWVRSKEWPGEYALLAAAIDGSGAITIADI